MRIAVGSDHAGFDLKTALAKHMADAGHQIIDLGTGSPDVEVDYPVFGLAVGRAVAEGRVERGICVCGTGIGIGIAANKVDGIRASVVHDVTTAGLARRHNDANVICLGGRTTGLSEAVDAVDTFFSTEFEGGRHRHRLQEIADFESGRSPGPATASESAAETAVAETAAIEAAATETTITESAAAESAATETTITERS